MGEVNRNALHFDRLSDHTSTLRQAQGPPFTSTGSLRLLPSDPAHAPFDKLKVNRVRTNRDVDHRIHDTDFESFVKISRLVKVIFPQNKNIMNQVIQENATVARRTRRIGAFLIDHFVMTFLMVSLIFLVLGPEFMDDTNPEKMMSVMLAVGLPVFLLYFAKDSIKGISLGRWILGIMVRDANNPDEVPSFGRLLVRNLFLIIWPIEFIVLATSNEKKRLGDNTAKTIVVNNPDKAGRLPRIMTLVAIAFAFFAFMSVFAVTVLKNSEAYKVAIKEIEQNSEIVSESGGIKGYGMIPAGNINITNGRGEAHLEIKVLGNEKDLNVHTYLTKEPHGEWELVEMRK